MNLEPVSYYPFRGQMLPVKEIRKTLENEIGTILDETGIGIRDRIKVFDKIIERRKDLVASLSLTFTEPENPDSPVSIWKA